MKKRYLIVLLVLILAVASMPVFAANKGTLTIENATIGKIYSAYKIFDVTNSGDAYAFTIADSSHWYQEITNDPDPPFLLEKIETSTGKYNVAIPDENLAFSWLQSKA
ncbi:MAG: hypothetical protein GX777_02510, partial [Fastidiosipila sp.]|nr:hypothetical protein [Fastidiosipila sp.]